MDAIPGMEDYPIKLGSLLFTMVEPDHGHEVAYNRWYERDHFYAGCMIGAYQFAGDRFVATRRLKDLRYPVQSPMTPDPLAGSYLAIYWILAGYHDEWNRWAVDQVTGLHANGRMFGSATHIHTRSTTKRWALRDDRRHADRARSRPQLRRARRHRRRAHGRPHARRGRGLDP